MNLIDRIKVTEREVEQFITHAMAHLEKHNPKCHGLSASAPWYSVDYPDYAAWHLLKATRDLVRYAGKGKREK